VTDAVLLDTHIVLWLDSGSERLRPSTRSRLDACWQGGGTVWISAVTIWEIAQLVDTGRISLDRPLVAWLEQFIGRPGVDIVKLTAFAAARAYQLHHLENRDPADRLLIATAIELACPLITYDDRIIQFGESHGTQYGFIALE
jgi:PIN domain nuclease of toxin-antitoxin system